MSSKADAAAKRRRVLRAAKKLFDQRVDWVVFFRQILGVDGIARQLFDDGKSLADFEQTKTYKQIQDMLAELRADESKADRKFVLTDSLALRSLRWEADSRGMRLGTLCALKLFGQAEYPGVRILDAVDPTNKVSIVFSISAFKALSNQVDQHDLTFDEFITAKLLAGTDSRLSAGPLSLYFDLSEFEPSDIADALGALSDLYRSVGGDGLVIDGTYLLEAAMLPEPAGV
jgi:hypothetical protein